MKLLFDRLNDEIQDRLTEDVCIYIYTVLIQ